MNFNKKSVAVVGAGPAGCMCAYFASKGAEVTLFDFSSPLQTLLYTGGGRCNLAYAEYDFRELTKFYPRGEKFLYSVFAQFATADTIGFFENIGVETYMQDDLRIFPSSNSAKEVRIKFLNELKHCGFKKEKVVKITKMDDDFLVLTDKSSYSFDEVVISVGGHAGFFLAESFGHSIVDPKPALTGLITKENFKSLQGVSLKGVSVEVYLNKSSKDVMMNSLQKRKRERLCDPETTSGRRKVSVQDDMIFTHEGISGPLAYKISSICAREGFSKNNPLVLKLDLLQPLRFRENLQQVQDDVSGEEFDFQGMLNSNPKKDIKNLVAEFVPRALAEYILRVNGIALEKKCCDINGKTRDLILKSLREFEVNVISPAKDGEVVTSGGVCLDEINPKNMQSKLVEGLYFCGEVIDVDGFCGGFNLQNCWSTGFVAGSSL